MRDWIHRHFSAVRDTRAFGLALSAAAALLAAFALSFQLDQANAEAARLSGYVLSGLHARGALYSVLCLALFALERLLTRERTPFLPTAAIVSFFLAVFTVFGRSFDAFNSWKPLFASAHATFVSFVCLLGLWRLFYVCLKWLLRRLNRLADSPLRATKIPPRRVFRLAFAAIFAAWLPYLLLCFPGSVTYDAANQLSQFLGVNPATAHHPWASTLLFGLFYRLGGSVPALGVYLYVIFQSLVCAAAFAYVCAVSGKLAGRPAAILAALYFMLLPTWGSYAQMYVKDTVYAGFFAAFFAAATVFVAERGECGRGTLAILTVSAILCALIRGNGLYAVLPSLLLLLFAAKRGQRKLAVLVLGMCALAVVLLCNQVLFPALGVAKGSVREMLSLPFQQTARCCIEYPEDVSAAEHDAIDAVLDYDVIVADYNPNVSDNVKNTYRENGAALPAYFQVWQAMGSRHPLCYGEAAVNACYGYFAPGYIDGPYGGGFFQSSTDLLGMEIPHAFPAATNFCKQVNLLWSRAPGLSALITPATYTWLLLLCTAALIRKKRTQALLLLIPLWLTLGINCVSPVNGLVRYTLPLMAASPLLIAYTLFSLRKTP